MEQNEVIMSLSEHLFWDIDKSKLDINVSSAYIIQRVLEYGEWSDWCVIYKYYGIKKISSDCMKMRTLDPKALSYICCISGTKKENYRCFTKKQ